MNIINKRWKSYYEVQLVKRAHRFRVYGLISKFCCARNTLRLRRRVCWSLVFVVSTLCSLFLMCRTISGYLEFGVTTNYRVRADVHPTFPMIVMCNRNPWNSAYAIEMLAAADVANMNMAVPPVYHNYDMLIQMEDFMKLTTGSFFTRAQRRQLTDLEGFVISCSYGQKPCNASQFQYVFNPRGDFLNCLRFNSGFDNRGQAVDVLKATSGSRNELTVELYVGLPDELRSNTAVRGVNVLIQDQLESPVKLTPSPLKLSAGWHTHITVVRTVYEQFNEFPYEYNECTVRADNTLLKPLADTSLFAKIVATNLTYTHDACLLACYQELVSRVCNCTVYWVDFRIDGYETCFGEQHVCAFYFFFDVYSVGNYKETKCKSKCPFACDLHRFDHFQSIESYPTEHYLANTLRTNPMLVSRYANQSDFEHNLARNVVKFSVNYEAMSDREASEEKRMNWDILLSHLGGHLHLFTGLSLLNFIEIIESVLFALITRVRTK